MGQSKTFLDSSMGCVGSAYENVPVTGHQGGALEVIPANSRYIKQEPMVLKLKEKYFCWSGDDATVKDLSKNVWFKMDAEGKIIAGYRKKLLSLHATAYITKEVEKNS